MGNAVPDPIVTGLAQALAARLETVVTVMGEVIVREIDLYRNADVKLDDLHASLRHNVSLTIAHLVSGEALDVTAPVAIGRLRAAQGVPLHDVLRAYRVGFANFWDQLLAEARHSGTRAESALLDAASRIWDIADSYSTAMASAYRDTLAERMLETDRRRSALVAALVDGPPPGSDTAWEIAHLLGFPYRGTFVLVMAEVLAVGEPPLPGLDAKLRAIEIGSAWRAQPGHEVGVLTCPERGLADRALDAVRASATGRVGVSPAYEQLEHTPRALRYAQVGLESLPEGLPGVRQLDDTPLTEMVMTNLETTRRAVNRILGGLLSLPEDDRTTLLATARAWLDAHGSAADAAPALYCHPNTVRYRMHRIEEYLRGPLHDPKIVAELTMALDAVGTFPALLSHAGTSTVGSQRSAG